jgi:hypothetical protein
MNGDENAAGLSWVNQYHPERRNLVWIEESFFETLLSVQDRLSQPELQRGRQFHHIRA